MLETIAYQRCGTLAAPILNVYKPFTPLQHQIIAFDRKRTSLLRFFYFQAKSKKNLSIGKFDYTELTTKTGIKRSLLSPFLEQFHCMGMVSTLERGYSPESWRKLSLDEDVYRAIEALAIY